MPVIYDPAFQQQQAQLEFQKWASLGSAVNQLTNSLINQREKAKERQNEIQKTLIAKGGISPVAEGETPDPLLEQLGYPGSKVTPPPATGTGIWNALKAKYFVEHPEAQGPMMGTTEKNPSPFTQFYKTTELQQSEDEHQRKLAADAADEAARKASLSAEWARIGIERGRYDLEKSRLLKDDQPSGWVMTGDPNAPMRPAKEGEQSLSHKELADSASALGINNKMLEAGLKKTKNDLYATKMAQDALNNDPDLAIIKKFAGIKESRLSPDELKVRDAAVKSWAKKSGVDLTDAASGGGIISYITGIASSVFSTKINAPTQPKTLPNPKGQQSSNPFQGMSPDQVTEKLGAEAVQIAQTTGKTPQQALMEVFNKYGSSPEAQQALARMKGIE